MEAQSQTGMAWQDIVFILGISLGALSIIASVIWMALRTWQVRMATQVDIAREAAYRKLAEEFQVAQQQTAAELRAVSDALTDLRGRVASIERILREVE